MARFGRSYPPVPAAPKLWRPRLRKYTVTEAAQFTRANSEYLSIADNAALSMGDIDFTIAGWFYLDSEPGDQALVAKWQGALDEFLVYCRSATHRLDFLCRKADDSATVTISTPSSSITTGGWYFFVAWHDSVADTINLQLNNGTAVTPVALVGGIRNDTAAFTLGQFNSGSYLNGRLDSVGIWKRTLTAAEKTWLYNGSAARRYFETGRAGTDGSDLLTNMEAWWNLDEASGTRYDAHGTNHLTDNNTVTQAPGVPSAAPTHQYVIVPAPRFTLSADAPTITTTSPNVTILAESAILNLSAPAPAVAGSALVNASSAAVELLADAATISGSAGLVTPAAVLNLNGGVASIFTELNAIINPPEARLQLVAPKPDVLVEPYFQTETTEVENTHRAPAVELGAIVSSHAFIPVTGHAPGLFLAPAVPRQAEARQLPDGVSMFWYTAKENSRYLLRLVAGGDFRLEFDTPAGTDENGDPFSTAGGTAGTTALIPADASPDTVRDALLALPNINPGDVLVSGGLGAPALTPNGAPDVLGIEFRGQYQGVRVGTLSLDASPLTSVEVAVLESPPGILPPRDPNTRYRVQMWLDDYDTGTLVREDEWVFAEEVIWPTTVQEIHYMRVQTINESGEVSAWANVQTDPGIIELTDGSPPSNVGAPTVRGGPTFLFAEWDPVDIPDLVQYDVHISTSSGFTPGAGTYYGTVQGTFIFIKTKADGTALAYGTTYYVKVIAFDADGASSVSSQGSAQMVQVGQADLVANNIITNAMLVGSISADKISVASLGAIEADLGDVLGGRYRTATSGKRIELGDGTIYGNPGIISFFDTNSLVGEIGVPTAADTLVVAGYTNLLLTGGDVAITASSDIFLEATGGRIFAYTPITIEPTSVPSAPASGRFTLFVNGGKLWAKDDADVSHQLAP